MKGNVIQMNTLHLNSVRLNGIGKVQSVSLKGGSTEDPVFPPVEPPVEPTPTYTLSASVTNGKVSAKRNGSAVNLPFTANEGDTIVVEVTPNDGYTFEGWNDGNTDNPRSITMTADVVLSAQCVEVATDKYINFADEKVKTILMANSVSSDGVGITKEDCQKVVTLSGWFVNSDIESFEEFEYFTKCTAIGFTYGTSNNGFYGCNSLKKLKLPSSVKTIGVRTFNGTTSLKSLNLDNVTTISDGAFNGSGIEEINAPSLATLGTNVFINCIGLKKITSLGNITTIRDGGSGYGVFKGCTSLEEADLPSTLTTIGNNAFNGCSALVKVISRATTPPTLGSGNTFTNATIYVPDASLEAYKTAVNWNTYADRIHPLSEIEGGHITTFEGLIGAYTFEGRSNEDADRDIVEDKSGYNNTLTLKSMQWGFVDSGYPDLVREGLWDDALWLSVSGYGEIALPKGLTDFTVIAKRFAFNANAGGAWAPLVGTGKSSGKGLFWLEYVADNGQYTNQVNGLKYTLSSLESEITWMTNTLYNGHRLTGTQGNDVHDGMVYINRFRGDVVSAKFQKIYAVYLFNRQLSPSEIEAFIKEKIDASYVLPTIE